MIASHMTWRLQVSWPQQEMDIEAQLVLATLLESQAYRAESARQASTAGRTGRKAGSHTPMPGQTQNVPGDTPLEGNPGDPTATALQPSFVRKSYPAARTSHSLINEVLWWGTC